MKLEIKEFQNRRFVLFVPDGHAEELLLDAIGGDGFSFGGIVKHSNEFNIYLRVEITGAPPAEAKPERCRGCPAFIYKLKNVSTGKVAPIDTAAAKDGNIFISASGDYSVLSGEELKTAQSAAEAGTLRLFKNHFFTCPNADKFRPKK